MTKDEARKILQDEHYRLTHGSDAYIGHADGWELAVIELLLGLTSPAANTRAYTVEVQDAD